MYQSVHLWTQLASFIQSPCDRMADSEEPFDGAAEVEDALSKCTLFSREELKVVGAGRTDEGVHALGQHRVDEVVSIRVILPALTKSAPPGQWMPPCRVPPCLPPSPCTAQKTPGAP